MTKSKPIVIAIDGPAASGKGSLAKKLAKNLNYDFLDTGALYRRVALEVYQTGTDPSDKDAVIAICEHLSRKLSENYDDSALRPDNIGTIASIISQYPEIRQILFDFQHNFPKNVKNGAVLDGRDIGTVICPNADIKLFVTASTEKRAERRTLELQSRGITAKKTTVLAEMQERDERDAVWLNPHLTPEHDAIIIDTSDMTPAEVFEEAMNIINSQTPA